MRVLGRRSPALSIAASFFVVTAAVLVTRAARAQADVPVRLEYASPAGCPDARAFATELESKSRRAHVVNDRSAPLVVIRITTLDGKLTGVARFPDESERRVNADACADVVSALAFVTALALDATPKAAPTPTSVSTSVSTSNSNSNSTATATATPAATSTPAASTPPPPSVTPNSPTSSLDLTPHPATPSPRSSAVYSLSAGAHAEALSAPTSDPVFVVPLFVEASRFASASFVSSARLGFVRASGFSGPTATGANFAYTVVDLDLCPAGISRGSLRADACLRSAIGLLEASGSGVSPAHASARPWFSMGPVARGRWEIASPFFVEGEIAIGVPVVRDRYFVEPDTTVLRAPSVGWSAGGGVGLTIF